MWVPTLVVMELWLHFLVEAADVHKQVGHSLLHVLTVFDDGLWVFPVPGLVHETVHQLDLKRPHKLWTVLQVGERERL